MPNFVAHASGGKRWGKQKIDEPRNVERVETVDCVRGYAEEGAAQYVKRRLGLSHYLRSQALTAILRPVEEMSHHLYGHEE
jgi:hypothetical protein